VAARWYLRYGLSYRDAGEPLAERGVTVGHVTIDRWVQRFAPGFTGAARPCRHAPGNRWFVGGTSPEIAGRRAYLYRAADRHGQVIDVLLPARRDLAAAALRYPGDAHRHGARRGHGRPRARLPRGSPASWSPRRCTPPGGTPATRPGQITHGRKPGSGRCAD
jgi:hypothetical protein